MSNILKNKNKQAGFFEIIVVVIIALLLMKYFGITVSTVVAWVKVSLAWFLVFFKDILK
jgi:nitric oxide reductase large subunit